jgi:hypothetical protein
VHVEVPAMTVAVVAAGLVMACGQPSSDSPASAVSVASPRAATAVGSVAAPIPNEQGDPACPGFIAWGRDPRGAGVLVTYWSDGTAPVTVLVRTTTGNDVAQRALLRPEELRLFEFPEIDHAAVREVLVMTNTRRCFAVADPATFG